MNKKKIIIIILVILILFGIYMLYNTFAVSTIASNDSNNIYDIVIGEGTTITVPKGSSKTVYFHLKNTNNGNVKYAVGYNTTANIEVKVYEDSKDKVSDIIGYTENKYIKLYLKNPTNNSNAVTITSVLGYENGGDLIVPDGITLITEVYTPPVQKTTLAEYITNLYTNASKSPVENNSIKYNYAPSESLMNDRLGGTTTSLDSGNIRYYGASPNNYIYFNCETYPDTNCELWRIIGVFNNQVKIIRKNIGKYSWDTSETSTEQWAGINEWPEADVMKLLNPGYETKSVGGSLYYNSKSGKCYINPSAYVVDAASCDFTTTGIKNDETKSKIAEVTWNLGGWSTSQIYSNQIYEYERGTEVYSGRSTTWTGRVALPYPSDYGYAVDFNNCRNDIAHYTTTTCLGNNWMVPILVSQNRSYLLTPAKNTTDASFIIFEGGAVNSGMGYPVYNPYNIVPTLYLSSNETIVEGTTGSQDNPYKLNP